ncbi:MAG: iron dicitrate transport regulator FecR [Planctomycetales bacterium]|nr:iron dicitrate transport regulator FecR [Planctomycetales bacterium]
MSNELREAAAIVRNAAKIVVFTGAGISAESGIPTFRDEPEAHSGNDDTAGFWHRFPVEEFATWPGLIRSARQQPRRVVEFVHHVLAPIADARPNPAHHAISYLEQERSTTIVTQNIDGLHQAAGSVNVQELHGSIFEVVTRDRRPVRELDRAQLSRIAKRLERIRRGWLPIPRMLWAVRRWLGLGWRGLHLPNLVLFGDALCEPDWTRGLAAAEACDCLIQIGCSGVVLPAAMLPLAAKSNGARVIAIDPQPTEADIWLSGSAAQVTPQLVAAALSRQS